MTDVRGLRSITAGIADDVVALRREIHRHPELGWHEFRTTSMIADFLAAGGLAPRVRHGETGLTVDIGDGDGPLVAFRADLDALPITEATDFEFASENAGVMHACGHDVHAAIAAGVARVLSMHGSVRGTVRFIFQPAEEIIPGGAAEMVSEGVLDGASSILAFHVDPTLPPGTVGLRADAITGASDRMSIELSGPGGHTSRPHQTVDLIHAAAKLVIDLPSALQRRTDPRAPIAVVFGRIEGGRAENVIPTSVNVGGTIRLFDLDMWRRLPNMVPGIVDGIVSPLGATAKVGYEPGSPPVVNDGGIIGVVRAAASAAIGIDCVRPTEQSLGSEDFSWFLEKVPGALVRLGAGLPDRHVDLHSADFAIDERCIPTGMVVGALSLLGLLAEA
ncbi:MAG TPA: amidohydrolase [Acidimicrobiia bacterium]|nr:amidohydrolase [Acidimicrobiia bacterium]